MSDEPSLPRLPAVSWDEESQSFSNNPRKRVRGHGSKVASTSSDPAMFSSDDDPGLDNYVYGRQKKRYVGTWYQQQPASSSDSTFAEPTLMLPGKPVRRLSRQVDSGVYLASDGAESDDMTEGLDIPTRPKLPQLEQRPVPQISAAELGVRDKIQACLDNGDEVIDLYGRQLEEVSNDTFQPLSNFSCIPVVTKDVAFEHNDPRLEIYLSKNLLQQVPGALFDLANLTVLTLRDNRLTELPPAISKLTNLTDLNVAQNLLSHIPAQVLDLVRSPGKLARLVLHPNPFLEPESRLGPEDGSSRTLAIELYTFTGAIEELPPLNYVSRHLGRSPVQISDSSRRILSEFRLPPPGTARTLAVQPSDDKQSATTGPSASSQTIPNNRRVGSKTGKVPSLMEVALRSCYQSTQLSEFKHYIPEELSSLRDLIQRAEEVKEIGGLSCTRCRRPMVIPTVEWVEWRELKECATHNTFVSTNPISKIKNETAVPFLHRACSWKCGPVEQKHTDTDWQLPAGYKEPAPSS